MTDKGQTAVFLDVTRLVRRAGLGQLTGIDRVEKAYLEHLCQDQDRNPGFLCRTALGWLVLDRAAGCDLLCWIAGERPPPPAPAFARLLARHRPRPEIEAALRARAGAVLSQRSLLRWFARQPRGSAFLNVGHMNLAPRLLAGIAAAGLRPVVMIHDTIPLDHPDWSGAGAPRRFKAALTATLRHAALILVSTQSTADDIARHAVAIAPAPPLRPVPLGVVVTPPDPAGLPRDLTPGGPYFVALGTIEPRKDHRLLLDVWAGFCATLPAAAIPRLLVVGRIGWGAADVVARLRKAADAGDPVLYLPDLPDAAVSALLAGAAGLLAPSRAEGFGLPAAEAAALGVQVLATDLAATRDVLGDWPTYLPPGAVDVWSRAILAALEVPAAKPPPPLSTWADHFNRIFKLIG